TIDGAGHVAVTALDATPAANLSTITNTGTKTAAVSENVTFEGNLGSFTTTVASDKTLTATAAVVSSKTIDGAGHVAVTALDATPAANLSTITNTGTKTAAVSENVTFEGNLGSFTTTVAATKTLTATAAVVSGKTIDGAGHVAVTALDATPAANLSTITNTGTKTAAVSENVTFEGNLGSFTTTVAATKTLTATAAVVSGKTIDGAGHVAVTALDATPAANLSTITNTGTKTAAVSENVTFEGNLGSFTTTVASDKTLTATAAVVSSKTIDGAGTVVVSSTDVSGANFGSITADLDLRLVSAGTAPNLAQVVAGQVLTLSAYLADGLAVNGTSPGTGTVVVLGDMAAVTADLSLIQTDLDISEATGAPTSLPTLVAGQELRVTALQADDSGFATLMLGVGTVAVELADITAAGLDFSDIAVAPEGTVRVEFGNAGILDVGTVMTGVDQVVLAGATTLTGAQANGVIFSGSGSVTITASTEAQTLNGTGGNDRIFGDDDATTTDTVNITQGGSDTLVFSGSANDFTVTGFNAGSTVGVRDVLDFSSITGLNNPNGATTVTSVYQNTTNNITGLVVTLSDFTPPLDASGLAGQFNFGFRPEQGAPTVKVNDFLAPDSKMIFLVASGQGGANTGIWLWEDADQIAGGNTTPANGSVDANELSLLATLNSVGLGSLTNDNVIYNPNP
ncbi:MAG: hypothetical protein RLZZ187_3734, partial [Pseudomonadota bacterium]